MPVDGRTYLFGEINLSVAEQVRKEADEGTLKEIVVCTHGGDLIAATVIYDAIVNKNVRVIGTGCVASAGVIILLGGSERFATPSTRFMTHPVGFEGATELSDVERDEMNRAQAYMEDVIQSRSKLRKREVKRLTSSSNYFGVEEAERMGFIQGIWSN